MVMATTTYKMEAMIRGYHVYTTVWDAQIGEELYCARETGNIRDPYVVAVKIADLTVGHIPVKISALCSLLLQRGGTITCSVTGWPAWYGRMLIGIGNFC